MTSKEIEHLLLSVEVIPEEWTTSDEKLRVLQIRATYEMAYQMALANETGEARGLSDYIKMINLNVPERFRKPQLDISMVRMKTALLIVEKIIEDLDHGYLSLPRKDQIVSELRDAISGNH